MTPLVWASISMAAILFLAITGIPLWMTFRHPERRPDFAEARAYFQAKAALGDGEGVVTVPAGPMAAVREHLTAGRSAVPGRRHAAPAPAGRVHTRDEQTTHVSA